MFKTKFGLQNNIIVISYCLIYKFESTTVSLRQMMIYLRHDPEATIGAISSALKYSLEANKVNRAVNTPHEVLTDFGTRDDVL